MITNKDLKKKFPTEFSKEIFYSRFLQNCIKRFRIWMVRRHLKKTHIHIDIGCGDASLLKVSPSDVKIGLDKIYGDDIDNRLPFRNKYADFITMLAAIEHFDNPAVIIKESYRILKDDGILIITTPLKSSEKFVRLLNKGISEDHKHYFNKESMTALLRPFFSIILFKRCFLNQLFICKKIISV